MSHRVLCVCLHADRQQFVQRALDSFRAQTYKDKILYVLDNGIGPINLKAGHPIYIDRCPANRPIGTLRNLANALSCIGAMDCPIIAHWDVDDWSHPSRLTEQVALLESSGKQAVGYRECLFYDSTEGQFAGAWLYSSPNPAYAIGSSLMYWREAWLKHPFPDKTAGEDTEWLMRVKSQGVSSVPAGGWKFPGPRMVCSIHGANTTSKIQPHAKEWKRMPEWDEICRGIMCAS